MSSNNFSPDSNSQKGTKFNLAVAALKKVLTDLQHVQSIVSLSNYIVQLKWILNKKSYILKQKSNENQVLCSL